MVYNNNNNIIINVINIINIIIIIYADNHWWCTTTVATPLLVDVWVMDSEWTPVSTYTHRTPWMTVVDVVFDVVMLMLSTATLHHSVVALAPVSVVVAVLRQWSLTWSWPDRRWCDSMIACYCL
jgi:hypothetical protein